MRAVWRVVLVAFACGGAIVALYAQSRVRTLEQQLQSMKSTLAARDSALRVATVEVSARELPERQRSDRARGSVEVVVSRVEFLPAAPRLAEPTPSMASAPVLHAEARVAALPAAEPPVELAASPLPLRLPFPLTVRPPSSRSSSVFAFAFMAGDGLNAWLHFDRDPGGYVDTWSTIDKLAHGAMGAVITQSALNVGVPRRWAAPITCAGAVGFEYSQGYVSWKDALAGCSGAVIATGIDWVASEIRR